LFHYLKFTEFLGCPRQETLDFGFSGPRLLSLAADILSEVHRPFIAIVLGTTWISKEWFFDSYARLIEDLIKETSMDVVIVDTMAKYDMACELEKKIQSSRLINLVGKTSILELVAVFKEASVGVGPDCGSAHISAAGKTPYVTLFGPTSPERTAPYGSEDLVVSVNMSCAPCYKRKCPLKDTPCMRTITVEDVKEKIFKTLNIVSHQL
jgi:lipopolysaccharide heptosyltransferase I